MATADTAKLIASLTLKDLNFTKGLSDAEKKLGKFESTSFRVGQNIGNGIKNLGRATAVLGATAVTGLTFAVKSGLDDLAELENAITSVDGAIAQLGLTGQLTGKQVADWANQIEADVDAAFDDKAIAQAATTLLRFGKVTPKNLKATLTVMTDLAAKTGDVDSAAELLAKSLAAPEKAAGKLAKQGIILTKQQQDQIKAMTEAGDVAGAQGLLLDAVAKSTAGAAKAMAGPYQDAINKTNDALEDAKKALAIGFLPVITKVADKLSKIAADPKALASIESFGKTLAGGLDSLIGVAERLPWQAIGTSLEIGGMGAKAILDAFVSLPPWVQTAVLTGWGLNKLTGGALSGIVGELGKGLIKGVLGMTAGVVNIKAATVTGAGGAVPTAAGGAGLLGKVGNAVLKVSIVSMAAEVANILEPATTGAGIAIHDALGLPKIGVDDLQWPFGPKNTPTILPEIFGGNGVLGGNAPVEKNKGTFDPKAVEKLGQVAANQNVTNERLESIKGYTAAQSTSVSNLLRSSERNESAIKDSAVRGQAAAFAIRDKVAQVPGPITAAVNAAKTVAAQTTAAARAAGQQTAAAIRDKDLSVDVRNTVNVSTSVSVKSTIAATQKVNKYTTIL